jgi:hypothetical protein
VAAYTLNLRAEAAAVKDAADRMTERRRRLERQADRLHKYLQESMQSAAVTIIKSPEFVLKMVKNPGRVEIVHEDMIPADYVEKREEKHIDKTKIKNDLKADMVVPGAMLVKDFRLEISPGPKPGETNEEE